MVYEESSKLYPVKFFYLITEGNLKEYIIFYLRTHKGMTRKIWAIKAHNIRVSLYTIMGILSCG
jgi:hypothetical protein